MAKPELEFFDPMAETWRPVAGVQGLEELILARDEETGAYTRLLRFAAGTDTTPAGAAAARVLGGGLDRVWRDSRPRLRRDLRGRNVRVPPARHAARAVGLA
jgi:hypothetical protein